MADVSREKAGFFKQVGRAVKRTHEGIAERVGFARMVDEQAIEELEAVLSTSDMGRETVRVILEALEERARQNAIKDGPELRAALKEQLLEILTAPAEAHPHPKPRPGDPYVTFLVGANGTGKTTTSGKLAMWNRGRKRSVMLAAADTFRPAAIEQLQDWANRSGAEMFKTRKGGDPSALVFDAVAHARARHIDELIVDTAGRLHTKTALMHELDKMIHGAANVVPGAPHEVLLVMDATTGQNGLHQARFFTKSAGVTGIVLTKLDGTARGGVAVAIAQELNLPVRFMGIGEQMDDFMEFFPEAFVDSLLEDEPAEE
ncbi:MAG: signal recognition particle-docking protein FtsY [Terracidiphilus sp.]